MGNGDAIMQLHQLHQLGRSLMEDLHRDEGLFYQLGLEGITAAESTDEYDDSSNGAAYNGSGNNGGYWNGNGSGWGSS